MKLHPFSSKPICKFGLPTQQVRCWKDDVICLTPLAVRNSFISELVNGEPLSDAMDSGISWVANKARNFPIVVAEEADFTGNTSTHLENALTTTKSM